MDGETREDHLDLPRSTTGRDTNKGAVIKMVESLVSNGVVERINEEATASFVAASIRPIVPILHKCRKTRLSTYSIFICQSRASRVANHWFGVMIGMPPRRIEALFEFDKLRMHSWL